MEVTARFVPDSGGGKRIKSSKVHIPAQMAKNFTAALVEVKRISVFGRRAAGPPSLSHHREPNAENAQTPISQAPKFLLKTPPPGTLNLTRFLIKHQGYAMRTLSIQVRCLLQAGDARWDTMESLTLEIGYPGRNGQTLWKHIGWLQEQHSSLAKSFTHALWSRETVENALVFDFLPVSAAPSGLVEKAYYYRTHTTGIDGRVHSTKAKLVEGPHTDLFFSFMPHYPGAIT